MIEVQIASVMRPDIQAWSITLKRDGVLLNEEAGAAQTYTDARVFENIVLREYLMQRDGKGKNLHVSVCAKFADYQTQDYDIRYNRVFDVSKEKCYQMIQLYLDFVKAKPEKVPAQDK